MKRLAACLSATLAIGVADQPSLAHAGAPDPSAQRGWSARHLPKAFVASGVTRSVNSCLDNGDVGTLRQVVGMAGTGDTIDLSAVPVSCSTITLTSGEIHDSVASLTFAGPTDRKLTITTGDIGRIFNHSAASLSSLVITNLTISHGRVYSPGGAARGGCIYSGENVFMLYSNVSGCAAVSGSSSAAGGGIYAKGNTDIERSQVTDNYAVSYEAPSTTSGGGIGTGSFTSYYSTVSRNYAAEGGGIFASDRVDLHESTIDANIAQFGAGIYRKTNASANVTISNSTISGNASSNAGGAMFVGSSLSTPQVIIHNSTIAFNSAPNTGGVKAFLNVAASSSIIANNSSPTGFADVYIVDTGAPAHTLTGTSNLIVSSNRVLAGTLTSDPQLDPLANHGGPTRTHALSTNSPAVNHGSNPDSLTQDQRTFARQVPAGSPDIGAYERQLSDDEIFYSGFQ
jgi:hypothetical protein